MSKVKVAALQMISNDDCDANLACAARLIERACEQGARLLALPENFAMFAPQNQRAIGQLEAGSGGRLRQFLAGMAKSHGVWIVGGTIPICDNPQDERPYSASLVINDVGEELARYDKIHLFDVTIADNQGSYLESKTYQPGKKGVVTLTTPFAQLGLSVCYDLRFPELFRIMFQRGMDILVIPAAFTKLTGEAHWLTLLRARAIENSCFVIAANQGGLHADKRQTFGHSVVISPWGKVLSCIEQGEGIALAELDFDLLSEQRKSIPVAQHQRFFVEDRLFDDP